MARWMKNTCLILALAATLFCSIGYAALSDTLQITGQVQVEPPDKIFIAEIKNVTSSNANFIGGDTGKPTAIDFPSTKFISNVDFNGSNNNTSTVTFEVKLVNGTSITQIYDRVEKYNTAPYNTSNVDVKVHYKENGTWKELKQGYQFPAGAALECRVTMTCSSNVDRNMMHEFMFVTDPKDLTQQMAEPLLEKYLALINDSEKYGIFADYGTNHKNLWLYGAGNNKEPYISNSSGYDADQIKAVNEALDNITKITVNGQELTVTVLLKQLDVCSWVNGEERLIYFTADPLSTPGKTDAPVFVAVFYQEGGKWVPLGGTGTGENKFMIFEGTARVCDKSGNYGANNNRYVGNFDTGYWRSSKSYTITNANGKTTTVNTNSELNTLVEGYNPNKK